MDRCRNRPQDPERRINNPILTKGKNEQTMNSERLCMAIKHRFPMNYLCQPAPDSRVRITTMTQYPNRTLVKVFVTLRPDNRFEITDEGMTLNQIEKYNREPSVPYRQQTAIAEICTEYNLNFSENRFTSQPVPGQYLPEAVAQTAAALARIAATAKNPAHA